MTFIALDCDLQ